MTMVGSIDALHDIADRGPRVAARLPAGVLGTLMTALGAMPTDQLAMMLRAAPARRALAVLLAMPADRIDMLLFCLNDYDIARLFAVAGPPENAFLLGFLDGPRRTAVLARLSDEQLASMVMTLPRAETAAIVTAVPVTVVYRLLDLVGPRARRQLRDALDQRSALQARTGAYEAQVVESLCRTAADVSRLSENRGCDLVVRAFHRAIGVAVRYRGQGWLTMTTVREAQAAVNSYPVFSMLLVTDALPDQDVIEYERHMLREGQPLRVLTWQAKHGNGVIGRALVGLVG